MKRIHTLLLLILFSVTNTSLYAAVYMKQDTNGDVSYSDSAGPGFTPINVPEESSTTTLDRPVTETKSDKIKTTTVVSNYKVFLITSPKEQENIQNQALVPVVMTIDPKLRDGDQIQLFVDGKPWGQGVTTNSMAIELQERGQHTIGAVIVDKDQRVIVTSNTVTFFVHRNSVITSPAH